MNALNVLRFVISNYHSFLNLVTIRVIFVITFTCVFVGQILSRIQNQNNAKLAAMKIFNLMETKPEIDSGSNGGVKPKIKGDTKFQNVHFSYPNKENGYILQGINMLVKKGEMIALLGPPGSGKSSLLSLIVRFFDPNFGNLVLQI